MRRAIVFWALLLVSCADAIERPDLLRSGPMLGYSTPREALIWVQTVRPAVVEARYWPEGKPALWEATAEVRTSPKSDLVAKLRALRLEPGTRYQYEVRIDGSKAARDYPLRFQTQPQWWRRADPPDFSVAIGSCSYVNDEPFDRPGEPYGGGFEIFANILRERPDLMIWLGDNVYLRQADWGSADGILYRYAHTRSAPELQALLGNVHHYAIWDDHDYGPNNSDRSYIHKGAALDAFRLYWGNPGFGLPSLPGAFTHFAWGDAEFFLLDDRYYRAPTEAPPTPEKRMLGGGQAQWLIDALTSSDARFKIVANGGQILNPVAIFETYARFPNERAELLRAIGERRIEGVVFLSGDRHFTELARMDRPGAYPLYDYTSSPLTSKSARPAPEEADNPLRLGGTLILQRNFGILEFSGSARDRVLILKAFSTQGEMLWEHRIRAEELRYPEGAGS